MEGLAISPDGTTAVWDHAERAASGSRPESFTLNDHEFLVIERDNRSNLQSPPQAPTRKTIYKIDLAGATDVSDVASLPAGALPADIHPVTKTLFINLLDADLNLAPTIPEKLEGPGFRAVSSRWPSRALRHQRQRSESLSGDADLCVRNRSVAD